MAVHNSDSALQLLPGDSLEENEFAINALDIYRRSQLIVHQTYVALGRTVEYESCTMVTDAANLNLNIDGDRIPTSSTV